MYRVGLFIATNVAVLFLLSLVAKLLGVDQYMAAKGQNFGALLIFAAVIGFTGSIISLLMSKRMALWSTGAQIITEPRNQSEAWLVATVRQQAQQAGIGMPDVAIYGAPEINAFATGASRNSGLVAVSTGLLEHMNKDQAEAVLAHEVSHIANGDMVTMALLQGVLNTFVVFLSRVLGTLVDSFLRRDENSSGPGIGYWISSMLFELVFTVLASIIAMWFSRRREFRADAGAASLVGAGKMISALERLKANQGVSTLPKEVSAFGIGGPVSGGLAALFRTHPDLDDRIAALRAK